MSKQIIITVTDEAHMLLEARARQTSQGLSVEDYAKAAIAGHLYESLAMEKKFAAARAALETVGG